MVHPCHTAVQGLPHHRFVDNDGNLRAGDPLFARTNLRLHAATMHTGFSRVVSHLPYDKAANLVAFNARYSAAQQVDLGVVVRAPHGHGEQAHMEQRHVNRAKRMACYARPSRLAIGASVLIIHGITDNAGVQTILPPYVPAVVVQFVWRLGTLDAIAVECTGEFAGQSAMVLRDALRVVSWYDDDDHHHVWHTATWPLLLNYVQPVRRDADERNLYALISDYMLRVEEYVFSSLPIHPPTALEGDDILPECAPDVPSPLPVIPSSRGPAQMSVAAKCKAAAAKAANKASLTTPSETNVERIISLEHDPAGRKISYKQVQFQTLQTHSINATPHPPPHILQGSQRPYN
jgi:hypothetical protein